MAHECVSRPFCGGEMEKISVLPLGKASTFASSRNTSQEQDVETSSIRCGHHYCVHPAAPDANAFFHVFVHPCEDHDEVDYPLSVPPPHGAVSSRSVHIQHHNSGSYIRTSNKDGLVVAALQNESEPFKFQASKYTGRRFTNIHTVIEVSYNLCGQRQCMSASDDNNVRLQPKESLSAGVKELDSTDSRFFILKPVGAGHNCFESTKCPDYFLACRASQIFLKHIPKAHRMLGNDPEVVFRIRPCEANPSSR